MEVVHQLEQRLAEGQERERRAVEQEFDNQTEKLGGELKRLAEGMRDQFVEMLEELAHMRA